MKKTRHHHEQPRHRRHEQVEGADLVQVHVMVLHKKDNISTKKVSMWWILLANK